MPEGGVFHTVFGMKFLGYCLLNQYAFRFQNDMLKMLGVGEVSHRQFASVNFHPMEVNKHSSNHPLPHQRIKGHAAMPNLQVKKRNNHQENTKY